MQNLYTREAINMYELTYSLNIAQKGHYATDDRL